MRSVTAVVCVGVFCEMLDGGWDGSAVRRAEGGGGGPPDLRYRCRRCAAPAIHATPPPLLYFLREGYGLGRVR